MNEHGRFAELKRSWDNWLVTVLAGFFMFLTGICLLALLALISPLLVAAWIYGRVTR